MLLDPGNLKIVSHCSPLHLLQAIAAGTAADRIVLAAEVVAVMSLVPLIMLKYVQV